MRPALTLLFASSLLFMTTQTRAQDAPSARDAASDPVAICLQEIDALHQFFQDWFNGDLPATDEAYARFADALDESFAIVSPSGGISERPALVKALRGGHGRWQESGKGKIWIENARVRQIQGNLVVATYEEWQKAGTVEGKPETEARGRLSTVVFRLDPGAPGGARWLHVHETWMR